MLDVREMLSVMDQDNLVAAGRAIVDHDVRSDLAHVKVPAMVVVGSADRPGKEPIPVERLAQEVPVLLSSIQQSLHDEALARRDDRTVDATTVEEAASAAADGFVRIPWAAVGDAGVERLAADAVTVRCLITADGYVPESVEDPDLVAVVARSY